MLRVAAVMPPLPSDADPRRHAVHTPTIRITLSGLALAALAALGACTKPESEKIAEVALPPGDSGKPAASAADSLKADSEQDFLRTLIDRHHGLIVLAGTAANRADASAEVRSEARALEQRWKVELDTMRTMLERTYRESRLPAISREDQGRNEGLLLERGPAFDRAFREAVLAHDRKDVELMDAILPTVTNPELKLLTERLRAEHTRAIETLRRKLGES
jgi:uncharacterized protein (DUF305 family)